MAPTLVASRTALPPEGAAAPADWPFDRLRTGQGQIRGPCLKGMTLTQPLAATPFALTYRRALPLIQERDA